MLRKARLYARISDPDGKYARQPVGYDRNGRPVVKLGKGEQVTTYLVRIANKFIQVGSDLSEAITQHRRIQAQISEGITRDEVPKVLAPPPVETNGRLRLADALTEYKQELVTHKRPDTARTYITTLDGFAQSCRKWYVDEIDRKDILAYLDWMRKNVRVRVPGSENQTYCNRLERLGFFLGRYGVKLRKDYNRQKPSDPGLLFRTDIPKVIKKKPRKYDQETIEQLLNAANTDERDYLEFLLWSGFRDEEVQYLQFSDFNFRNSTVMVQAKPEFGWKPKDCEEREITLPTAVTKRIKERMSRIKGELVFPNAVGAPDCHLLKRLHAVAEKAGLNLKGKRAGHMFRKTAGSRVAKKEGLAAAMAFLGHSDIKTTAVYLAADTASLAKKRQAVDEMYAQQGD